MKKVNLEKLKNQMVEYHWTEDMHHDLKELSVDDAKKIVDTLDENEIYDKVNIRQFQEDYIADYIEYLWNISESSFWKHVKTIFNLEVGILWSDNMFYFQKLCDEKIPDEVLNEIMNYIAYCTQENNQDLDAIGCAIKSQVNKFNRKKDIKNCISKYPEPIKEIATKRIEDMLKNKCKDDFY